MRILHTGDLHFGSALRAFSPRAAHARRERQLDAFANLLAAAKARGAQMILLAGDCFDTPTPDADTVRRFYGILSDCGLPAIIAPGNHDFYRKGGFWDAVTPPDNVYLFDSPALAYFDFPETGVRVYGYAFTGESMPAPALPRASELPADRACILLAHADVLSPLSPYAPLATGELAQSGFAYAALGHVHKPTEPKRFGNTLTAYCGFFAGRGFDETGAGGARLVELNGNTASERVLESTADRFEWRELDCTGLRSTEEVRAHVAAFLESEALAPETALRLSLTGHVGLSCHPDVVALAAEGAHLALFEVLDETLPVFDADFLAKDPTLRGAFYRALLPRLQSADEETRAVAATALRLGFAAIAGKEV